MPLASNLPMHKWAESTGEHHTPLMTPLPTPQNTNQCNSWQTEPLKQNYKLQSNTNICGGWMLNLPQRKGAWQGAKLSVPNSQWTNTGKAGKVESRVRVTSHLPKQSRVDPRADLLDQRAAFKTERPHVAGGGADQRCNWRITHLPASENNSSDHPAWTGRLTSPHNFN
jgi:hypothetical protein